MSDAAETRNTPPSDRSDDDRSDGQAPYYVTTPIYYVNDKPHIGHAYTTLACDVMARYMRLAGRRVLFLTGTDEHGQKVEKSANAAGMAPQAFTDQVSQNFRDLALRLNFSNDDFIRTTETRHRLATQELWRRLKARDQIYLGSYAGWYAVRDEAFYTEAELVDGRAPSGAEVEWVEEPSYFFRLSAWGDRLLQWYEQHPDCILPKSRRNEVVSFVKSGLRDLSVSRTTFRWGVPVPDDEDHIMYVWLDALTNYITATGFPDETDERYRTFWPADLHMVGKDILRFHAVYWPAFLMAADLEPPRRVFAHGWWTNEGQKISKSVGNVIDPLQLVETYGLDQVRFFLLREVPFGNDGDFSHQAMIKRMNTDLANDLGNLVQRVLSFVAKHCQGQVPTPAAAWTSEDQALLQAAETLRDRLEPLISTQAFHQALEEVWNVVTAANRYIDAQAPWSLRKSDRARMETVLYVLMEVDRYIAILLQPVMPESAARILDLLGVAADARSFACLNGDHRLPAGGRLPAPTPVFPRFVDPSSERPARSKGAP